MTAELEILDKVHSFYNDAFSQLVTYTVGIMAFVGVLVPVVVGWLQMRSLKLEKENLEQIINIKISEAKSQIEDSVKKYSKDIENELNTMLEKKIETEINRIDNQVSILTGKSHHIQGNSCVKQGFFAIAAVDFCTATISYLEGQDEVNVQRTLRLLIDTCFPKIYSDDYESTIIALEENINALIKSLEDHESHGRYQDSISTIRDALRRTKSRTKPIPENK